MKCLICQRKTVGGSEIRLKIYGIERKILENRADHGHETWKIPNENIFPKRKKNVKRI